MQQPKARLYGRKAREMRRRDHTIGFRRSWRGDWTDGRAQTQENFDWGSQDGTARDDMDMFLDMLYADEYPAPHYGPYTTESRGFTIIHPVETKALEGRHYQPREPMSREEYRERTRLYGNGGRRRVRLIH